MWTVTQYPMYKGYTVFICKLPALSKPNLSESCFGASVFICKDFILNNEGFVNIGQNVNAGKYKLWICALYTLTYSGNCNITSFSYL